MDNRDFLNGIDEDFQRLMSHRGNGNGHAGPRPPAESVTAKITARLGTLTHEQRVAVLEFMEGLRQKGRE